MRVHELKTVAYCWDAVESGAKKFEVRRNDRGFQPGDTVVLRKLDSSGINLAIKSRVPHGRITYYELKFKIGWILQGGQFGIEPGYCVFSLEPLEVDNA